jgi:hypothetical protein
MITLLKVHSFLDCPFMKTANTDSIAIDKFLSFKIEIYCGFKIKVRTRFWALP